jgi:dolichol-phosphate mannosyltransferase
MDRRVLQTLLTIPEKNTTIFGLVLWMGYKQVFLPYRREARRFGSTKWSLDKKIKMVIDSLTSFSVAPIRIWSYLGSGLFLLASVGSILSLGAWVAQAAWAGIGLALFIILGVLGLQLVAIGVIGEYVWRTLDESRPRPSYIIRERIGFDSDKSDGEVSPP